jgi:LPXTG-motif cell wall-anchored protein
MADGSGTAYADGAAFSFETNETLFAQWGCPEEEVTVDEELAATGSSNSLPLMAMVVLMALGAVLLLVGRRRSRS